MTADDRARARALIEAAGARATLARLTVLQALLATGRPLSHQELLQEMASPLDRVTAYRVLDWLADTGIAHRINTADRITRFSVSTAPHCHAHFQCEQCGRIYCLPEGAPILPGPLPAGFVLREIEMTVKGTCAECAPR